MPQVPLPQVSDAVPQSPRFTAPMIEPIQDVITPQIQQQGQAMSQIGSAMADIAVDINEEHATATSLGELNGWTEDADKTVQGFYEKLGHEASLIDDKQGKAGEASDKVAERMEAEIERREATMSSDLAKHMFRQYAERRMVNYRGGLFAHEVKQIGIHKRAEFVAGEDQNARKFGASGDEESFDSAVANRGEVADIDGLGTKARDEFLLKLKTAMHSDYVSNLLADEDTQGADEVLKKIPTDEIDARVRQRLRRKIDGVLSAEKLDRIVVDVVRFGGHRNRKDQVAAARANLPKDQADQFEKTTVQIAKAAVLGVAKKMGVTDEQMKSLEDGDWQVLLTDPRVIDQLDEDMLTLGQEIIQARGRGNRPAGDGLLKRSMATLKKMYDDGDLSATELIQARAGIVQQIRYETAVHNEAAREALDEVEQILQRNRETGGPAAIDSPAFRAEHPDLIQQLQDHGMMDEARKVAVSTFQRVTDPLAFDDLHARFDDGRLAKMTHSELKNTYYGNLSAPAWNQAEHMWAKLQPDPKEAKTKAGIKSGPAQKWDVPLRRWAGAIRQLGGKDNDGVPKPRRGDVSEQNWWLDLQHNINEAVEASGREWTEREVLEWARARELKMVDIETPGTFYGFNQEEKNRPAMEAEISRLAAADDPRAKDLAKQLRDNVVVMVGDRWIRTAGSGTMALGEEGDPIPERAIHFIRDQWRLDQLRNRPDFKSIEVAVARAGGMSPKAKRDEAALESIFGSLGVPPWPSIGYQTTRWDSIRSLYQDAPDGEPIASQGGSEPGFLARMFPTGYARIYGHLPPRAIPWSETPRGRHVAAAAEGFDFAGGPGANEGPIGSSVADEFGVWPDPAVAELRWKKEYEKLLAKVNAAARGK